jgi:glycosyl transferase family 25
MNIVEKIFDIKLDRVYCISLEENINNRKNLTSIFKSYGFEVYFHIVNRNNDPTQGCMNSHIWCLEDAKKNNYNNILIFEDDVTFNDEIISSFEKQKIEIPQDFDIFYLGYHINKGYKYDEFLLKTLSAQCTHSYIVSKKCINYILNNIHLDWKENKVWYNRNKYEKMQNFNNRAIDLFYAKIICDDLQKSYGIYPMWCNQKPGYSTIEKKVVDYTKLLLDKSDIFYKRNKHIMKTYLINLDRRNDRLQKFVDKYSFIFNNYERFNAIDGSIFDFENYKQLFDTTNYKINVKNPYKNHEYNKGVLGCALSHYKIWEKIINNMFDINLVLEDDIELSDNFIAKLNNLMDYLVEDEKWDIVFLGFTDYKNTNDKKINDKLIRFSGDMRRNGGGTFGYLITKNGAKKLIKYAKQYNIQQAIDWFMIEQFDKMVVYKAEPELIFSKVYGSENEDSDVQKITEKLKPTNESMSMNTIFKEVFINDMILFMDERKRLLYFDEEDIMSYYGHITNDNKLVKDYIMNTTFQYSFNGLTVKNPIMFYTKGKIPYHIRKIMEKTATYRTVVVYIPGGYNAIINGVYYFNCINDTIFDKLVEMFKIKTFITLTPLFFMNYIINKDDNITFLYTGDYETQDTVYNKIQLKNQGRVFIKNFLSLDNVNIITNSENKKVELINKYNIKTQDILNKIKIKNYDFPVIKCNENMLDNFKDKKYIYITYDEQPLTLINFFSQKNKNNESVLVCFSNSLHSKNKNIIVISRNQYTFQQILKLNDKRIIYISYEHKKYSDFNILSCIINNKLMILPKLFGFYKKMSIQIDEICSEKTIQYINKTLNDEKIKTRMLDEYLKYRENFLGI